MNSLPRPSTLSGVVGGVKGVWGKRDLRRRGRMKQITFRAAVKKSNRALLGADFLGTANRKCRGVPRRELVSGGGSRVRGGTPTAKKPQSTYGRAAVPRRISRLPPSKKQRAFRRAVFYVIIRRACSCCRASCTCPLPAFPPRRRALRLFPGTL